MEFSNTYRSQLCDNIISLFELSINTTDQTTHFFKGTPPSLATLTSVLNAEWRARAIAPSSSDSGFNAQWLGSCNELLKSLNWAKAYKRVEISNDTAADVSSNTVSYSQAVAVRGKSDVFDNPIITGFDHAIQGDQTVTWALTLWRSSSYSRGWYILNIVGTGTNPDAEILLWDTLLTKSDPELTLREIYSPVL